MTPEQLLSLIAASPFIALGLLFALGNALAGN